MCALNIHIASAIMHNNDAHLLLISPIFCAILLRNLGYMWIIFSNLTVVHMGVCVNGINNTTV